ncbi:GNAT family N-acetyltransferase [Halorarius halobius]|uniref:GNAT family N-acetyltransferase n=1 Tax=Halorarius halobius TaxID=2962671 RepID=UPI0020CD3899|nr:GNAT family N-acetyltransferase [Halorarius halobius]
MNVAVFDTDDPRFDDAVAIRELVFVEEQGVPMDRELDGRDDAATHFLLTSEDDPVATARARPYDGALKAERVAVLPDYRGEGFGVAVMDALESYAADEGYDEVVLHAQVPVVAFYERLGYEPEGEEFEDAGIPHRTMRKRLS